MFDKEGGFYFTDLGKRYPRRRDNGGVYYALPDGSKIVEVAYPILSPNGCGLSPDGKTLYVADAEGAGFRRSKCKAPARSEPKKDFLPHSGGWWRASAAARASTASRSWPAAIFGGDPEHRPYHRDFFDGDIVRAVKIPTGYPTNIYFGGANMHTAYITLSDGGHLGAVMQ